MKWTFRWAVAPLLLVAATTATSAASPLARAAATAPTKVAVTPKRSAAAIRVMQQLADFLIGLNSSSELTADNVG